MRGKGLGSREYKDWESNLPQDITKIRLHASDAGHGPSHGFWDQMGVDYEFPDDDNQMIKHLKGEITERKMADLYHSTDADKLSAILKAGQLTPGRNAYVSLTRDKNYNYANTGSLESASFVIDQAKLAYNRKIEPYDWHMDSNGDNDEDAWARDPGERRSESEERVKGPISLKYVKAVYLPTSWSPAEIKNEIELAKHEDGEDYDQKWSMTQSEVQIGRKKLKIIKSFQKLGIPVQFSIKESINEVADQPYKTFSKGESMGAFKAKFIAKGSLIQVNITPYTRDKKIVDVGFFDATDDKNPTIDMTGKGDAFRIFATVGAIVKDYVAKNDPDVLTFSGKTRDPSRIRLYDLIAKNIGKYLPGYKLGDSGVDLGDKRYTFVREPNSINEARDGMLNWLKAYLPTWPEYVLYDWLYKGIKDELKNPRNKTNPAGFVEKRLRADGLYKDTQWKLVPNFQFKLDVFNDWTVKMIKQRWGGATPGFSVPNDAARHATQQDLLQKQGISREPVIMIKRPGGYELVEGWHRTIQHFAANPEGYVGPAWVANGVGVSEDINEIAKVKLSAKPDDFGAWVNDSGKPEKTVVIPTNKIHVFEPDDKFDNPHHAKNLANIIKAIKAGKKLPPILVRRHGIDRFQVVDGHHRFMAYRMAGVKNIPARVVDPKNITGDVEEG